MSETQQGTTVILIGRLIDGTGREPMEDAAIVVENGRIKQVGPQESVSYDASRHDVIDAGSDTLSPGLIDAHCHIFYVGDTTYIGAKPVFGVARALQNLAAWLEQGVTTIRDVGTKDNMDIDLREAIRAGVVRGPRLLVSGSPITMTAGIVAFGKSGWAKEVTGPYEARRAVRQHIGEGVDLIKVMATASIAGNGHSRSSLRTVWPVHMQSPETSGAGKIGWTQLSLEELQAVVEEAHNVDLVVACHAIGTEGIKNALNAGVDSIEHGTFLDEEAVEMMVAQDVFLVPTLAILQTIAFRGDEFDYPQYAIECGKRAVDASLASTRMAHEAGVRIGTGTDPFNNSTVADEIETLSRAGLSNMDALIAATRGGAELLRMQEQIGTIEVGKIADMVILGGDPLEDLSAIRDVKYVFQEGRIVKSPDDEPTPLREVALDA